MEHGGLLMGHQNKISKKLKPVKLIRFSQTGPNPKMKIHSSSCQCWTGINLSESDLTLDNITQITAQMF
jgi:hypothetical protein